MATISNVNGKKITKIKYKGEIFDTGGSGGNVPTRKQFFETRGVKYLFYGYKGSTINDDLISYNDISNINDISYIFSNCSSLIEAPNLNTSNVTNMSNMFNMCTKLASVPLYYTSNVTDMSYMFYNCYSLIEAPNLNTSNVTNMSYMFSAKDSWSDMKLQNVPFYDTKNVTDMSYMFFHCIYIEEVPLFNTSKVTKMGQMFTGCKKLKSIPQFDTSLVTSFNQTFDSCKELINVPTLNTSSCTYFSYMFRYCEKLPTIDITHMNITSTSNSSNFASDCYSLTKLIIRNMTTIPTLNSNAFTNCYHFTGTTNATYNPQGLKDGRIYVPDDKVEALKTATNWSVYADIIVPLSTLVE